VTRTAPTLVALLAAGASIAAPRAMAQAGRAPGLSQPAPVCGLSVPAPASQPAADSGPVVLAFLLCFEKQGGTSMIDPETYLYYIRLRPSEPSRDRWISYTDATEQVIRDDFQRLWSTNFLDDLLIRICSPGTDRRCRPRRSR
jgi:hypothetical protein